MSEILIVVKNKIRKLFRDQNLFNSFIYVSLLYTLGNDNNIKDEGLRAKKEVRTEFAN